MMHAKNELATALSAKPRLLADGFKFTEGPAADADGNIYFVDIGNRRVHFWHVEKEELSLIRDNSGGADGMFVTDPDWAPIPGIRVDGDTDTTGAGDSATAGCVLALCSGASCAEAAVVGNLVASITVQQLATTGTASPDDLQPRLKMWHQQNG